jgi:hypothetical protein
MRRSGGETSPADELPGLKMQRALSFHSPWGRPQSDSMNNLSFEWTAMRYQHPTLDAVFEVIVTTNREYREESVNVERLEPTSRLEPLTCR